MTTDPSFASLLLFIAPFVLALGIMGLALAGAGWRGQRIGDHPVCRKCGFDLFGLPGDQARCPECGGDLAARGAIVRGHRQRRMGLVYSGVALLLLFAVIVVAAARESYNRVDWQRAKPVAWLAWEARGGSASAWKELERRVIAGRVSKERVVALTDHALAWQKDLTRRWEPAVGDFVEAARHTITEEQWRTYAIQVPQVSLLFRAKVRRGDPLPAVIVFTPSRGGRTGQLSMRFERILETDDPLIDVSQLARGGGYSQSSLGGSGTSGLYLPLNAKAVEAAAAGKRTTKLKIPVEIREKWDAPGIAWTPELSADWELVERDVATVEIVPDDSPKLRGQIEGAVKVQEIKVRDRYQRSAGTNLSIDFKIGSLPAPLSHEVILRGPTREWKVASVTTAGATSYGTGGFIRDKDNFDARRVDVILRPSTRPAAGSVNITRAWNGEIVIPDVEVKWPATVTTQPATTAPR